MFFFSKILSLKIRVEIKTDNSDIGATNTWCLQAAYFRSVQCLKTYNITNAHILFKLM